MAFAGADGSRYYGARLADAWAGRSTQRLGNPRMAGPQRLQTMPSGQRGIVVDLQGRLAPRVAYRAR